MIYLGMLLVFAAGFWFGNMWSTIRLQDRLDRSLKDAKHWSETAARQSKQLAELSPPRGDIRWNQKEPS